MKTLRRAALLAVILLTSTACESWWLTGPSADDVLPPCNYKMWTTLHGTSPTSYVLVLDSVTTYPDPCRKMKWTQRGP